MRRTWHSLLLGLLSSPAALANGMNPVGKNAWDYYVSGNGQAIYDILQSVKMLMLPWGGGGMFESLLIAIALLGSFLVIIEAGFSPSKGVEKLIGYFITLAFVVFLTMGARVNVTINDNATGYYNTVTDVPAIVGVPASIISEIGYRLEQGIEEDFSIPDGLKVTKSGMYDVMGQTLKDANRMVITDPNLRLNLTGYVENCVVPSIGLGRVSVEQLMSSNNLLSTFSAAATPSLMTPYYPVGGGATATSFSDQGTLEQCGTAYGQLSTDVKSYAGALINAQSAQWQSTGVMVPFATAMQDVLQQAASGGGGNPVVSGYGTPEDYILQSSLINTSRPAFQKAAADLGENPVMLSTAIAQADQAQRSSWYTTVTVFHNMTGYVYIVLQAFVLALVPIIAVMLLIPGMGAKIFLNYLQVLLWLVLWGPLFALDNFVSAVLTGTDMHNLLAPGLTMLNSAVVKESTVNMGLAAGFLGTLIPLLAWGIVKGSFAFTEFIMAGMASSFAQQAGSLAASGNVSLGNTSLDNVGMNKYSTSITSDVGDGGAGLGIGAGALSSNFQLGGTSMKAGGTDETLKNSRKLSWAVQEGHSISLAGSQSEADRKAAGYHKAAQETVSYANTIAGGVSELKGYSDNVGIDDKYGSNAVSSAAAKWEQAAKLTSTLQLALKEGVGEVDGVPVAKLKSDLTTTIAEAQSLTSAADEAVKFDQGVGSGANYTQGSSYSAAMDAKSGQGGGLSHQASSALSSAETMAQDLTRSTNDMMDARVGMTYVSETSQTTLGDSAFTSPGSGAVSPTSALSEVVGGMQVPSSKVTGGLLSAGEATERGTAAVPGEVHTAQGNYGRDWNSAASSAHAHVAELRGQYVPPTAKMVTGSRAYVDHLAGGREVGARTAVAHAKASG